MAVAQAEWENGLCEGDCGTCWGAWCCECFVFGRTKDRMTIYPDTDSKKLRLFNGACCLFFGAGCCQLAWVPMLIQRGEVRNKFGIHGDGFTDCLVSFFCTPCAISQMEMEMKKRANMVQTGDAHNGTYVPEKEGMVYGAQN